MGQFVWVIWWAELVESQTFQLLLPRGLSVPVAGHVGIRLQLLPWTFGVEISLGLKKLWHWQWGTKDGRLNKKDWWWNERLEMSHSGLEVCLLYWKPLRAKIATKDLYVNKWCPLACLLMDCSMFLSQMLNLTTVDTCYFPRNIESDCF